ncbi:hypothetical protein MKW94_012884 [Papaver nudicaule]|uniref:Uncharacterized protein n=1 Tax=Papaver nudicaule TaxID=74823 RepID=A0AA42AU26_PAPNU|nr:hypothetical protein [Papaver nudicaule]
MDNDSHVTLDNGQPRTIGGSGQRSESDNMNTIMQVIADLREHQRQLEERIGVMPVRTAEVGRNYNEPGELLVLYLKFAPEEFCGTPPDPEKAEEWLQNAEHVLEHVSNDQSTWVGLATYKLRGPSRDWWNATKKSEE